MKARLVAPKNRLPYPAHILNGKTAGKNRLMARLASACRSRDMSLRDPLVRDAISDLASKGFHTEAIEGILKINDQYDAAKAIEQSTVSVAISGKRPDIKMKHYGRLNELCFISIRDLDRMKDVRAYLALEVSRAGFHHEAIAMAYKLSDPYRLRSLRNLVHDLTVEGNILHVLKHMATSGSENDAKEMAAMIDEREVRKEAEKLIKIESIRSAKAVTDAIRTGLPSIKR